MTARRGIAAAVGFARCALRSVECRQTAAAAAMLQQHGTLRTSCCSQSCNSLLESRELSHAQASPSTRGFFTLGAAPPSKAYKQRRLVGWTPEQLYTVVSRVEDYHKFVPWCQKSKIVKPPANNYMEAELEVGFQVLVERYTSQVFLSPPQSVRSRVADSSLFHHLDSTWTMEPGPTPRTCWLSFSVDFAFRSQLHGYLADLFFSEVVKQMSGAFEGRCTTLYGPSSLLSAPSKAAPPRAAGAAAPAPANAAAGAGSRVAQPAAHAQTGRCCGHAHSKGQGHGHGRPGQAASAAAAHGSGPQASGAAAGKAAAGEQPGVKPVPGQAAGGAAAGR